MDYRAGQKLIMRTHVTSSDLRVSPAIPAKKSTAATPNECVSMFAVCVPGRPNDELNVPTNYTHHTCADEYDPV